MTCARRSIARLLDEILTREAQLDDQERRQVALQTLNERLGRLWKKANDETHTPERSQARRLLRSVAAGAAERTPDKDYLAILERYSLPRR